MRQGQQHARRARGRGRRPQNQNQNQNNRVFDSNGPDVKVRGTASTIYEKYLTLSRDAQSFGDRVAAENYLQHAEHYLRIVAANKPPVPAAQPQPEIAAEPDGQKEISHSEASGHEASHSEVSHSEASHSEASGSEDDGHSAEAVSDEGPRDKPAPRTRRPRASSERPATRRPRNAKAADKPSDKAKPAAKTEPAADADADDGAAAA